MLKVAGGGGVKRQQGTQGNAPRLGQWLPAETLPENFGDPGGTWSWEGTWTSTGHDPGRLWTCQRVGTYGKPGSGLEQQRCPGDFFQKRY